MLYSHKHSFRNTVVLSVMLSFLFILLPVTAGAGHKVGNLWFGGFDNSKKECVVWCDSSSTSSSITIPASVKVGDITYKVATVDGSAFAKNNYVISVIIPSSVTSISHSAFEDCSRLEKVIVPSSVKSFGQDVFKNCPKLVLAVDSGSAAAIYAKSNNIKTTSIPTLSSKNPTKVTLNNVTIAKGAKKQLVPKFTPSNASKSIKSYRSSKPKIASVSKSGVVKGIKNGKATITIVTANGKKDTCVATVKTYPVKSISLPKTRSVLAGDALNLSVKFSPSSSKTKITWTSNKKSVATVTSKGQVRGVKEGTVTITAKSSNGKKATCRVTVRANASFIITSKPNTSATMALSLPVTLPILFMGDCKSGGPVTAKHELIHQGNRIFLESTTVTLVAGKSFLIRFPYTETFEYDSGNVIRRFVGGQYRVTIGSQTFTYNYDWVSNFSLGTPILTVYQ